MLDHLFNSVELSTELSSYISIYTRSYVKIMKLCWDNIENIRLSKNGNFRDTIKCNSTEDLQCHHILPVNIEPLLSADVDNCMTLCYNCHKEAHKKDGCKLNQLYVEEC